MENAGYIFAAYTIIWALVFGYVIFLVRRQAHIKRQLDSLQEAIKQGPATQGKT
jgi:CcmD family protein